MSNKSIFINFALIIMAINACTEKTDYTKPNYQEKYSNILNISKIPAKKHDLSAFGFSDMGAWQAYSLAPKDSMSFKAGFVGPLLMKDFGTWLGKKTAQLTLLQDSGEPIQYDDSTQINYYPGKLEQKLFAKNLKIVQELIFVDNRTALITNKITNTSNSNISFSWTFVNEYFSNNLSFRKENNQFHILLPDSSFLCISFDNKHFAIHDDSLRTNIIGKDKIIVKSGETYELVQLQSYFFNRKEWIAGQSKLHGYLKNSNQFLKQNKKRWNTYLSNIFQPKNKMLDTVAYQKLAVKSLQTLVSNWRSPAGALKHNGLFPSAAYHGFYGFWSWDSWKHAVALAQFDAFLAKESVRCMFDFQDTAGMIADCVYQDSTENNWRDTKPPLAAWAVWSIFEKTSDTAFVQEMYPELLKYHKWWYKNRDVNNNGICEYGSTDGSLIAAKWESGMDNAVRFDSTKLLQTNAHAWSMNQESVDLNVFLQKEKEYMAKLASVIGNTEDAKQFESEAAQLSEKVNTYFWSVDKNYFFDYNFEDKKFTDGFGPEGWLALWTNLATKEQAEHILHIVMDSSRFNTKVPFPTLDASHPSFNPLKGYWRGPVWIDQLYFGIEGLKNYGYDKEANILRYKFMHNTEGLLSDEPIRENYHPLTGEGLNAEHFSWSAAYIFLLLTN